MKTKETCRVDGYKGAIALIEILYSMGSINKATYDSIKRSARKNEERKDNRE